MMYARRFALTLALILTSAAAAPGLAGATSRSVFQRSEGRRAEGYAPGRWIRDLPARAARVKVGKVTYRYLDGIFYTRAQRGYVMVAPPLGARVAMLPVRAIRHMIDGRSFWRVDETFFRWEGPRRGYQVVLAPRQPAFWTAVASRDRDRDRDRDRGRDRR